MSTPQHTELLGLSLQQLTEMMEGLGQPSYRARQLLDGLYRQRWSSLEQFTPLSLALRQQLAGSGYAVGLPQVEKKFVSSDGTVRYLLRFADGESVETVWMPEGDGGEAGDGSEDGDAELRELAFSGQQSAVSKRSSIAITQCQPQRSESAVADERSRRACPECGWACGPPKEMKIGQASLR